MGPGIRRLSGKGLMMLGQFGSVLISYPSAGMQPAAPHVKATDDISCSQESFPFYRACRLPQAPQQAFPSEERSAPDSAAGLTSCFFISLFCFLS